MIQPLYLLRILSSAELLQVKVIDNDMVITKMGHSCCLIGNMTFPKVMHVYG